MMRAIAFVLACVLAAWGLGASATPQHKVATGLWIDPNESGWGLNLFHQGATVWGSLFVYGPDGQPRWYTASDMTSSDDGAAHDGRATITGDLIESTGPWFGGAFTAAAVQRRKVGTMTIDLGDDTAAVTYTVDGARVSKQVIPFTFGADELRGSFVGYIYDPVTNVREEVGFGIGTMDGAFAMNFGGPASGNCSGTGSTTQVRDFISGSGTYTCTKAGAGSWSMRVDVTPEGFVGSFRGLGVTSPSGRIAVARDGSLGEGRTGWRNDLWFPADEPGWGVNILEQGDTIFATLFVYDAQGRPRWYSASNLHRITGDAFVGEVVESSGPYFGTSFNPAAVTRRVVGTMSFAVRADGTAQLTYGVDGVGVSKVVQRYAYRKNTLTGTYLGHRWSGFQPSEPVEITINDDGNTFTMDTSASPVGHDGSCRYTAPMAQVGEQRRMEGDYTCSSGRKGRFLMRNVIVTFDGFTATFDGNDWSGGHMEGVRREKN